MPTKEIQVWDLWVSDVAAQGLSFARGRLNATDVMLVHAAPEKLNVEVHNGEGQQLATYSRYSNGSITSSGG